MTEGQLIFVPSVSEEAWVIIGFLGRRLTVISKLPLRIILGANVLEKSGDSRAANERARDREMGRNSVDLRGEFIKWIDCVLLMGKGVRGAGASYDAKGISV